MKIQNSCAIVKLIAQIKTKEGESASIKLSNFKIRSRIIDLKHHRSRKVLRLVRFNLSEIKKFPFSFLCYYELFPYLTIDTRTNSSRTRSYNI